MKRLLLVFSSLCGLALGGTSAMAAGQAESAAVWVVDPAVPGDNLPPAGRSQFDRLFAVERKGKVDYELPFPFVALLARLDAKLERDAASPLPPAKRVLIPLGRSLQRTAAAPDYFAFPRVVVAADAPPASSSAPLLKDRLYIGYQEKSAVLEVISYNEAAGRFEFQLVKNYRAGATPQVVYANRTLCFACHQNGAPIFARALWDETNANPQVAALLAASGQHFYGIPPQRGVDVPYAIDSAVKRANGFALTQRLWQEGCGGADPPALRCRAGLFLAALRHALADGRKGTPDAAFEQVAAVPLRAEAARRWPGGLAVGSPDIPNRNPLQGVGKWPDTAALRVAHSHVPAAFEPLAPRPAQEIWRGDAADAIDRLVGGLSEFVAATDRQRLAVALAASPARTTQQRAPCRFEMAASRWSVRCQSAAGERGPQLTATLEMRQRRALRGQLERLSWPRSGSLNGVPLRAAASGPGEHIALLPEGGSPPRGADGNPLARIAFELAAGDPGEGRVLVEWRDEFAAVEQAVDALAAGPDGAVLFGARPFPREALFAALFARLGAAQAAPCCQAAEKLAPPRLEVAAVPLQGGAMGPFSFALAPGIPATAPVEAALRGFYPYCAACHQSAETFPPNFLSGNSARVAAALRQCAPRLYVRLAMAGLSAEQREKTPMPPETMLPAFATDRAGWRTSPARAALLAQVGEWLHAESGQAPKLTQLLAGGYEALRPCLPAP